MESIKIYASTKELDGFISNIEAEANNTDITGLKLAKISDLRKYALKEVGNCWGEYIKCLEGIYKFDYDTKTYHKQ